MDVTILFFILGLLGLWLGSGFVINGSITLAKKLNINETFIGLTILSIGTSLPEIFTHIIASSNILLGKISMETASNISIGTNIGSNIIQITLITGLLGLLTTIHTNKKILKQDYTTMLGGIALLFIIGLDGRITRFEGTFIVLTYLAYLYFLQRKEKAVQKIRTNESNISKDILIITIGLIILIFAADKVLIGASHLANIWGVTESLIGIVLIGVSTALPELLTALRGILKGRTGLSLGTLIGSNITNPMLALGLGAIISEYTVENIIQYFDIPFWFVSSGVIYFFFKSGFKLGKIESSIMVISYIGFIYFRIISF